MARRKARKKKVRVFEIWLNKQVPGCPETTVEILIDEDLSEDAVEAILNDNINDLIGNEIESGWRELDPREVSSRSSEGSDG